MRLIETEKLEEDMLVGKTIYGGGGLVLLVKGTRLRKELIESIKRASLKCIYIDDEFSKEIVVRDVIREELRQELVTKIKSFFASANKNMDIRTVNNFNRDISAMINQIIDEILGSRDVVVNLIDFKSFDDYTYQHSVNVAVLATVLGVGLGYKKPALVELSKSGLFHDIGKMFVDKDILNKKGRLTEDEFKIMKNHPQYGFDFVKNILGLSGEASIGIIHHHERYDGQGYPHGREKDSIHINAQVIAIADVFDAITSKRVYHEEALPSEAIEYIMANIDKHFSKNVVDIFLRKIAPYPVGTTVELSNGMRAVVFENYEGVTMRPKVKIITEDVNEKKYIDLSESENNSITIIGIIK